MWLKFYKVFSLIDEIFQIHVKCQFLLSINFLSCMDSYGMKVSSFSLLSNLEKNNYSKKNCESSTIWYKIMVGKATTINLLNASLLNSIFCASICHSLEFYMILHVIRITICSPIDNNGRLNKWCLVFQTLIKYL